MKKALVVGINNYSSNPLYACINDATTFGSLIAFHEDGTRNFDVRLSEDVKNANDLRADLIQLFSGRCDTALFYFSGHAGCLETDTYLLCADMNQNTPGLSMTELLKIVSKSEASNKIVILDCCYAGNVGLHPFAFKGESLIVEGLTILAASQGGEPSEEMNHHGVFTYLLLSALKGGAADISGNITVGNIYSYISQAMSAWGQQPVFKTNTVGFNIIRKIRPKVPIDILYKIAIYFPLPTEEYQLDPSYEFTNSDSSTENFRLPLAVAEHIAIFKDLQLLQSEGLVVPVGTPHMYYAAMERKACKLTALGCHYWLLAKGGRI